MRIWLDDLRSPPPGFTHVKTLAELNNLLLVNQEAIEIMSFDHDLGEGEPDGYEIVKWLARNHLNRWPAEIRVHSDNGPGAENIRVYDEFVRKRLL